nr:ribonuclease H-like domain-containing protein [Tanacetum cinerariifolium]
MPFQRKSAVRTQFQVPRVSTVNTKFPTGNSKFSTADLGNKGKAVKASPCWIWRPKQNTTTKGYWDSGCSRHMTGNISYLSNYEPYDGGYVSFGQGGGKITGKGIIKTGKLEFENVYFVKDLKYNLFSVSQIDDNKNSVLFTDSECIVLGRDFKLKDDTNVLLRTPRQHNMYSIDLNNIVPHNDLTCLVSKASADEYMLWHRRLVVTDDISRFTWTFFLKTKDETSGILRNFITEIENLKDLKAEAVNIDCYVQNRVLGNKSQNRIPYELFNGRTPAIGFLKPFGCHVMILNTLDHLGKFDAKGDEGYFIGYFMSSKAFRVFNKRTKKVEENLHVDLLENKLIEKEAGPNWLFDIDTLTNSMNYVPVMVPGTSSTNFSCAKDDASQDVKKDVSSLRYIAFPNWFHEAHLKSSTSNAQDACNADAPESSGNSNPTATPKNPPADQMKTLTVESAIPTVSSPVPSACLENSPETTSGLLQVEARLVEFKTQEIKFYEKIRGLEFDVKNKNTKIERLRNELERINKEKEGLDSNLIGFESAAKDLDTLLGSQRSDKNKEGLGYNILRSNFEFKNKACFKCGHFDHLAYDCGVWVEKGKTWPKNNFAHKNVTPRADLFKTASVSAVRRVNTATPRPNVNSARPKTTQDLVIIKLIQRVKRLERELKARTPPIKIHYVDVKGRSRSVMAWVPRKV